MASDHINQGGEGLGDDFFEQMLSVPYSGGGGGGGEAVNYIGGGGGGGPDHHQHHNHNHNQNHVLPMFLGLGHGSGGELGSSSQHHTLGIGGGGVGGGGVGFRGTTSLPLGLNLDPNVANTTASSFLKTHHHQDVGKHFGARDGDANPSPSSSSSRIHENDPIHLTSLFPAFGHLQSQPQLRPSPPQVHLHQPFQGQAAPGSAPSAATSHPPPIRPRVRARRGQATDPHSIAERLRRERIAERMKALQELVPSCNKTDRAVMLDEIVDYVKFLRLQVKVLSMSRLGGAGAVAHLIADVPQPSAEGDSGIEGGQPPVAWERWSNDGTEEQVAKLMEEDIGAAMQFLQSKELCIMPISLASAFLRSHQQDTSSMMKPESNNPL